MRPTFRSCLRFNLLRRSTSSNLQFAFCNLQFAILFLLAPAACSAAIRVEAYRGEPFGIGRVTIDLPQGASPANDDRFALTESDDRVLYPVLDSGSRLPVRQLLRSFLNIETPSRATFYFMFRGDDPLRLTAHVPDAQEFTVQAEDNPEEFNELLDDWWDETSDRFQDVFQHAEYPVLVENYLTANWARRLDQPMPTPSRQLFGRFQIGQPWVSQLLANEAYQAEVDRDLLLGRFGANEHATLPLPAQNDGEPASAGGDSELPLPDAKLPDTIEPLAAHVPQECFYLRFGNFPNYLWFRDFLRHWQGDLGNMIVMQSVDYDNSERFQKQIAVGESKLSRVMGPAVIRDVAIIGLDMYMRDGAAMGILFQANNNMLLSRNLGGQRQDAKGKSANAKEETLRIAGHDVSFISTPDGRIRSYYVVDGDFHLVANSRRLVERFLEAGAGQQPLAGLAEFQEARTAMPLTRDDTIFLFASSAFFKNLAGPQYRIELDRRLRSIGEMRALKLARLAARVENNGAETIDELVAAELLPAGFAQHPDGSKLVALEPSPSGRGQGEGAPPVTYRDSLRGNPGWMVAIPDMPIDRITPSEARRYAEFRRNLDSSVGQFSPVAVALKRSESPDEKGLDRITADVRVAPYSQMPIARWPNMLGPAATARVAPIKGDVASLELIVDALGEPVHLFGGLRDFQSPLVVREGQVKADVPITEFIRAYVGSWPRPHLFDRFLGRPGEFDNEGIARTNGLFDLWLRRADDFFLFSFQRDILLDVGRQLAMVEVEKPAQIRLRIDDLHDKQVADAVTAYGYSRARDASASGSRFMNSLTTQLQVPPQEARAIAENLVAGKFDCPLGGDYTLVDPLNPTPKQQAPAPPNANDGEVASATAGANETLPDPTARMLWASTATTPENRFLLTVIPADYTMPLMNWFRGLTAEVARANDELTLHAALDMVHIEVGPPEDPEEAAGGLKLPSLGNLFGGFGGKKDEAVKPAAASEEGATR